MDRYFNNQNPGLRNDPGKRPSRFQAASVLKAHLENTKTKNESTPPSMERSQSKPEFTRAFDLCIRKTRGNITLLADQPKSAAWAVDGNYFSFQEGFFEIGNWTSSFFTGMALIAWQQTEDECFLHQVERLAPFYCDKVFKHHRETMHDLGFLYSLYSVALYKLTSEKLHREIGLRAADVLAERFLPAANIIRAWGRMDDGDDFPKGMTIVDCMMNLPLLYWASTETGNPRYQDIAVRHADTTLKVLVRPDDSVYHAYHFDLATGQPLRGDTFGGWAVESHWARGAAWAIYGFALSYRYTRDSKYLETSLRLARKFIANLDDEGVPLWDFKPAPATHPIRDASAGSVAVCGLQELLKHRPNEAWLKSAIEKILGRLCSDAYLDFNEECAGVQRHGQVGDGTPGGAQGAYTSWGDYFLMEALNRELHLAETFW
jgi:unsaturated chondroitin disaccharide hydrolase